MVDFELNSIKFTNFYSNKTTYTKSYTIINEVINKFFILNFFTYLLIYSI